MSELRKNKSGVIIIQVIDKSSGKYKLLKTIGSSANFLEVERLFQQGQQWIREYQGQFEIDFQDEKQLFSRFISGIKQITVIVTDLLLGKIFNQIGFNQIEDELFRQLVLARLCFPVCKLRTVDY